LFQMFSAIKKTREGDGEWGSSFKGVLPFSLFYVYLTIYILQD